MFADSKDAVCVEFTSTRKAERRSHEASNQTETLKSRDAECQAKTTEDRQAQTEENRQKNSSFGTYDAKQLQRFLNAVVPNMLVQLEKNLRSHAFDGYGAQFGEEEDKKLMEVHTLKQKSLQEMPCSDISWNSTGAVIGVAYGMSDHDGWCTHSAGLAFWNLNLRDFCATKPSVFIETSTCLSAISFHPTKPFLIVGGNLNGKICVWSLNKDEDMLIAETGTDDSGHSESITTLAWIKTAESTSKYEVASSGLDGKILVWLLQERSSQMILTKGFVVLAENLPRSLHPRKKRVTGEVGVTRMSFARGDHTMFFFGLEGGGVVQGSLNSAARTQAVIGNVPLMSPVVLAFDPHPGYVSDVGCAPFGTHVFASCGSDSELRVYSVLQAGAPVLAIHTKNPLASLSWSPCRPLILAAVSAANEVLLFNLQNAQNGPEVLEVCASASAEFCRVRFNQHCFSMLATADTRGRVQVWRLGKEYTSGSAHESAVMSRLGRSGE